MVRGYSSSECDDVRWMRSWKDVYVCGVSG